MTDREPRLLDAAAIARHYGVSRGTVYRWSSEDGWTRYGTSRARLWDLADAQSSYQRRRETRARGDRDHG